MTDDHTSLARRVAAVERALDDVEGRPHSTASGTDGRGPDPTSTAELDAVADRLDRVESRLDELEAAIQAVRGYVGGIRAVNRDVERRADLALARTEPVADGDSMPADQVSTGATVDAASERPGDDLADGTAAGEPADGTVHDRPRQGTVDATDGWAVDDTRVTDGEDECERPATDDVCERPATHDEGETASDSRVDALAARLREVV